MDAISIREFARRDNCSDRLVRKAIDAGYLRKLPDGKLDASAVGTAWRKGNWGADQGADSAPVRTSASARSAARSARTPRAKVTAAALEAPDELRETAQRLGVMPDTVEEWIDAAEAEDAGQWTQAQADRRKATAMARLRELEYDTKVGLVVPIDVVSARIGKAFASVRTRILAIPAEQAPRLHRLKTPAEVQDALQTLLVQALEALTQDDHLGAGGA